MTVLSKPNINWPDRWKIADEWFPWLFYSSEVLVRILVCKPNILTGLYGLTQYLLINCETVMSRLFT